MKKKTKILIIKIMTIKINQMENEYMMKNQNVMMMMKEIIIKMIEAIKQIEQNIKVKVFIIMTIILTNYLINYY